MNKAEYKSKIKEFFNGDYCVFWDALLKERGIVQANLYFEIFVELLVNEWRFGMPLLNSVLCAATIERGLEFCAKKHAALLVDQSDPNEITKCWRENNSIANAMFDLILEDNLAARPKSIANKYSIDKKDAESLIQIALVYRVAMNFIEAWDLDPKQDALISSLHESIEELISKLDGIRNKI